MDNLLKFMEREIVKQKLLEDGYSDSKALDETVNRLVNLSGASFELLADWIYNGKTPAFMAIEGVDSNFLREKLNMKDPAIIIAYAMLLENAEENSKYFKYLSENIVGFYPDTKQIE